jgi:acyl dehydratase
MFRYCHGVSGQRHAPAALYSRGKPPVAIGQEAGWASELVWTQRIEVKFFAYAADRNPVSRSSGL